MQGGCLSLSLSLLLSFSVSLSSFWMYRNAQYQQLDGLEQEGSACTKKGGAELGD